MDKKLKILKKEWKSVTKSDNGPQSNLESQFYPSIVCDVFVDC